MRSAVSRLLMLAGLLAGCGDDGERDAPWVRVEDDALDGINIRSTWGVGEEVWGIGRRFDFTIPVVVHSDGTRWEVLSGGEDPPESSYSLWATASEDVWLVGEGLLWHWNGAAWSPVDLSSALGGTTGQVRSVWGTAPDDMWISVDLDEGDDIALRYDGASWQMMFAVPIEWEYEDDEPHIGPGCSVSRNEVWVLVSQGGGSERTPTMFRWDGVDWEMLAGAGYEPFCAAGQVWVFWRVSDLGGAVASRNGGDSWNRFVRFDEDSGVKFAGLWAGNDGDGWIVGSQYDDEFDEWLQIWRISGDEVSPTLDLGWFRGAGGAIWQTESGHVLAFGSDGLVFQYTGAE